MHQSGYKNGYNCQAIEATQEPSVNSSALNYLIIHAPFLITSFYILKSWCNSVYSSTIVP